MISNNNASVYINEVKQFVTWCDQSDLELNISKTKKMVIDFTRQVWCPGTCVYQRGEVERVDVHRYLGIVFDKKLSLAENTDEILKNLPPPFHPERLSPLVIWCKWTLPPDILSINQLIKTFIVLSRKLPLDSTPHTTKTYTTWYMNKLNYLTEQNNKIHGIKIILRKTIRSERQFTKTFSLYNHSKA